MKFTVPFLIFVFLASPPQPTLAYEVTTHKKISQAAVEASVLKKDTTLLSRIGLRPLSDEQQKFPAPVELKTIEGLVAYGAEQEDNAYGSRFLHHFYDPLPSHSPPLFVTEAQILASGILFGHPYQPLQASPDWALEETQQFDSSRAGQYSSFRDARSRFFYALTGTSPFGPGKARRDVEFGFTFKSLGHIIHHIQDMAQPQHVKNEQHPLEPASLYEHFTKKEEDERRPPPYQGYEPVFSLDSGKDHSTFNTPRKFWTTRDGKGLAEFTNYNFVTYGHNFTGSLSQPEPDPIYPNPGTERARITAINGPIVPGPGLDQTPLDGKMYFIGTPVTDRFRNDPLSLFNERSSTYSIYDEDLQKFKYRVDCFPPPCTTEAVFSVNSFTMRAAHQFLIPRAVGYSAGLVNYFFRGVGKVDLVPDPSPQNLEGYLIQNLSDESMEGIFSLYYDSENGVRHLHRTWSTNGELPPHGEMLVPAIPLPNDPNHLPKEPGLYMLVFKGHMGEEGDRPSLNIANPAFAVAAKLVHTAFGGLITTAGGDARDFAAPGAGGAVTIETGALLNTLPPATETLEVRDGETRTLTGSGLKHYSRITIRGTLNLIGDTTLRADGPVMISGMIDAQSATNLQDGAKLTIESPDIIFVAGRIDTSGLDADRTGSGPPTGGIGGSVTIRTASPATFAVPTIITRGGDAALTDPRYPEQNFVGAPGGAVTITTFGTRSSLALRFSGERFPASEVDPLPPQQGAHELPTRTLFRRGILTTGGYGGQFSSTDVVREVGSAGGNGGSVTIDCQQSAQVQFDETDLFTGGNIDVLLKYDTPLVFSAGERPRFVQLVQRTGAMGGRGSMGGLRVDGGDGGSGGAGGSITINDNCVMTPAPASFTTPAPIAPLFGGIDPRGGTSSKLPIAEALDTTGHRLYTVQAIGGGGGIPGGSAFTLAHCSVTGDRCAIEDGGRLCPFVPGQTQICLPDRAGDPGQYGPRGADGAVSCGPLHLPSTLVGPGLVCQ